MSIFGPEQDSGMSRQEVELLKRQMKNRQQPSGGKIADSQQPSTASKVQAAGSLAQIMGQAQGGESGDVLSSAGQGAAVGGQLGGPKGALIGAGAGTLAGIMSSRAKRKQRQREANKESLKILQQLRPI